MCGCVLRCFAPRPIVVLRLSVTTLSQGVALRMRTGVCQKACKRDWLGGVMRAGIEGGEGGVKVPGIMLERVLPNNVQQSVAKMFSLGFILKLSSDKTIIKGGRGG